MDIYSETVRDYGVPPTMEGVRLLEAQITRDSKITSPGHYLHVCRVLANRGRGNVTPEELEGVDTRLVVMGWNRVSPSEWMSNTLNLWLDYWDEYAKRPHIVGSSHNGPVEWAFVYFWIGLPANLARRLPSRTQIRVVRRHCPTDANGYLAPIGSPIRGRVSRREQLRLVRVARANDRASVKDLDWSASRLATKTLEALGRLTPELQAAALDGVDLVNNRTVRIRDLNWARAAQLQQQMREQPAAAVAWATGKRQLQLLTALGDYQSEDPLQEMLAGLYPEWRSASVEVLLRKLRGESLQQLGDDILEDSEVTAWLKAGTPGTPEEWLRSQLPPGAPELETAAAMRWLINAERERKWRTMMMKS